MAETIDSNKINGNFKGKDILSLSQFSKTDIELLFTHVPRMKEIAVHAKPTDLLQGNIVTLLFYEPSSRTYGSFGASVKQLGGQTIDILNPEVFSSVTKGESLEDTIQVFEAYSDAIVLRHPVASTAKKAALAATHVPVINAGDGIGEHPTQALLDLYTIYERFQRLDNLTILFVGDMKNGRTVHSLMKGLSLFSNNTVYLLSPESLKLDASDKQHFEQNGLTIHEISSEQDIPQTAHVWYWTRVQKERFEDLSEYEKVKTAFILSQHVLKTKGNENLILMHPLPRVGEIEKNIDFDKRAVYLTTQIRNGMYVRMALLGLVLGKLS